MDDVSKQFRELADAAEKAHRMFAPTQHFIDQFAKSSAILASQRTGLTDAIQELQRRQELFQPQLKIDRLVNQMRAAQEMTERFRASFQSLEEQSRRWKSLIEPSVVRLQQLESATRQFTSLADSFVTWESSATQLSQRFADIGLLANKLELSKRLFEPTRTFTDFALATVSRIESTKNEREAIALESSLQLAEEQLFLTTDAIEQIVEVPDEDESISDARVQDSPYIQQEEILSYTGDVNDALQMFESSPAIRAVDLSRSILGNIATCNEVQKVAGGNEIFKPTTRLLEVYSDLPWLIPIDKTSFAQFVDCLYFLFYEGAGKDKLRFLNSQGGPIPDSDFDFILCIKHLRNKWTRHDADHGKEAAIRKAWSELAAKFQILGLSNMPVTPEDFRQLHLNMLIMADEFTRKILNGLVNPS